MNEDRDYRDQHHRDTGRADQQRGFDPLESALGCHLVNADDLGVSGESLWLNLE